MSQSFAGVRISPFLGAPYNLANNLCTKPTMPPLAVPLLIDWTPYWTAAGKPLTLGLSVNLQNYLYRTSAAANNPNANSSGGLQLIDAIRGIKIDNSQSSCPISVVFDDSKDIVTAPPNTVVTLPVTTNGMTFKIYAQGLQTNFIPLTQIFLFNSYIYPSVDPQIQTVFPQYLGSPTIQRANTTTPGFAPPALGDQLAQVIFPLNSFAQFAILPAVATIPSGFYYITAIKYCLVNPLTGGVPFTQRVVLNNFLTTLLQFDYVINNTAVIGVLPIFDMSGLQIRLDAANSVTIAVTVAPVPGAASFGQLTMAYTYNPN